MGDKIATSLQRCSRVGGIAVLDFGLTVLLAIALVSMKYSPLTLNGLSKILLVLIILIIAGSAAHVVMDMDTVLNYYLGLSDDPRTQYTC